MVQRLALLALLVGLSACRDASPTGSASISSGSGSGSGSTSTHASGSGSAGSSRGSSAGSTASSAASTSGSTGGSTASASSASSAASSASTGSSGSTASASTGSTGGTASTGASSSGSTGGSGSTASSGSSGTTGDCCAALNCASGCDPDLCECLDPGGTTGGGQDAGSLCLTQNCVVYAESAHELYQVEPSPPNDLTLLCEFQGAIHGDAGVNDIAVAKAGEIYGITKTDLYVINPNSCVGTHKAQLPASAGGFNCLTFDRGDTLIAADANGHVATIDVGTGQVSDAGHFGHGLGCSGDIVAISDGTIYATAKLLDGGSSSHDVLVTLDPSAGYEATRVSNQNLGYAGIFGLGYWGGQLYGFDKHGNILGIDPAAGTSSLLHGGDGGIFFFGAGTTPLAPITTHN